MLYILSGRIMGRSFAKKTQIETISLNDTGQILLDELRTFSHRKQRNYITISVNYKRNYLFEGVPDRKNKSNLFTCLRIKL